jgi:hypothetical protein
VLVHVVFPDGRTAPEGILDLEGQPRPPVGERVTLKDGRRVEVAGYGYDLTGLDSLLAVDRDARRSPKLY